jgi:hypothetical protein
MCVCVFVGIKVLLWNKFRNMTDKNNWVEECVEHVETNWNWKTSQATGEKAHW